jgi:hypothetical protein
MARISVHSLSPSRMILSGLIVHISVQAYQVEFFEKASPTFFNPRLWVAGGTTANRSSDTNRVGPLSLAQGTGRDFLFLPQGSGIAQFCEPVDARLLPDARLL